MTNPSQFLRKTYVIKLKISVIFPRHRLRYKFNLYAMSYSTFFNTDLAFIQTKCTDSFQDINFKHNSRYPHMKYFLNIFEHSKESCISEQTFYRKHLCSQPQKGCLTISNTQHTNQPLPSRFLFFLLPSFFLTSIALLYPSCVVLVSTFGTRPGTILHIEHPSSHSAK